jgi:hypothetical protein
MANIKIIQFLFFQKILFSNSLLIFKLREEMGITTTLEWSTKTTSHMALAELFRQTMLGSMMANSKMEQSMDTAEGLIKILPKSVNTKTYEPDPAT